MFGEDFDIIPKAFLLFGALKSNYTIPLRGVCLSLCHKLPLPSPSRRDSAATPDDDVWCRPTCKKERVVP